MLFDLWGLGGNIILAWTRDRDTLLFLAVRHYAIVEAIQTGSAVSEEPSAIVDFINKILVGPKFVHQAEFEDICSAFGNTPRVVSVDLPPTDEVSVELVNSLVRRYGVTLVRERAVVLIDAVGFSLRSPLEQVAMLNSLSYSVNTAYSQLLSKDVRINFARTTTGDGFYIWNRASTVDANIALYKLMMLILADNAIAQRKAKRFPVPRLRTAFHVGEHYEFYQVEALNPTTFGYIVGQVTIELARIIDKALPGQILLGDFDIEMNDPETGSLISYDALEFVERTAASLQQLQGLAVAGDNIETIRCYLTGESAPDGRFSINRYRLADKHALTHFVYNAKLNIHCRRAEPVFLGVQHRDLHAPGAMTFPWPVV